jgi:tetratricopeptide (TPR) repeat protein/predicted Ser/Thr protein kinase
VHGLETSPELPAPDQTPPIEGDFEQRRAISAARARLFGATPMPSIGRYPIERRIGGGGMGDVYLATDPELGRTVAIKRMREDLPTGEHDRLRAEARALARISHPNVVQVYEVGVHEGRAFVAMEYVEGTTLRSWLSRPHGWRERVAMLVAAGRGLAAVHLAGLVHRDFKPDNVLIGDDGRARVADFGVALGPDVDTDASAIAGTIHYMAPEQLRGQPVDARSDQFSFCVVLYEALWGCQPFALGGARQRLAALEHDQVAQPRRFGQVPRVLWAPIRRGLRHAPAARWASLEQLLDTLESIPGRRIRRRIAAVVLPLAVFGAWVLTDDRRAQTCADTSIELSESWNPERRANLVSSLASAPVGHAQATAPHVVAGLDAWAKVWLDERREQCEAASSERDAPALAEARRRCLERQRTSFLITIAGLQTADPGVVDRAIEAVDELPDPRACSAATALEQPEPPTTDQFEAVELLRDRLAELRARRELGHADVEAAAAAVDLARELGHRPTIVEALAEHGQHEMEVGSPARGLGLLDDAALLAAAIGDRGQFATVMTDLALYQLTQYSSDEAPRNFAAAEQAWAHSNPDAKTQARLAFGRSKIEQNPQAQREHLQQALRTASERQAPAIWQALAELAEGDERLELFERAVGLSERAFGPLHPQTGIHAFNLAMVLLERGEVERAQPLLDRAVSIWTHAHGRPHPSLASAHLLLGKAALVANELERAEVHARTVVDINASTLPAVHYARGQGPMLLSRIAGVRGDRAEALRYARDALAAYEAADGARGFEALEMRNDIASNELGLGHIPEAELEFLRVLELADDAAILAFAHLGLAELELRRGALELARAQLDAAAQLGVEALGSNMISHAVIAGLVDLRAGCRSCDHASAAKIAEAMRAGNLQPSWLRELELTSHEAERLGLRPLDHDD